MTTIAISQADLESLRVRAEESEEPMSSSVANPRRTTWTGYAKNATDRLPAY